MRADERYAFSRARRFRDLRLLNARFQRFRFAPHFHYCYSIGVVTEGALRIEHCGRHGIAPEGSILLVNPGEVHAGQGAREGAWALRSFYVGETVLQDVARFRLGPVDPVEGAARAERPPVFRWPIVRDPELSERLVRLHTRLETRPDLSETECSAFSTFGDLIRRYATPEEPRSERGERDEVQHVRGMIDRHYSEELSLELFAGEVGLSPFHFLRVFRDEVGLTPHKYLVQVRVERARALLSAGHELGQAGLACGFSDQSHLTRHFKRILGITPGCFQRSCEGSSPFRRLGNVSEWIVRSRRRPELPPPR